MGRRRRQVEPDDCKELPGGAVDHGDGSTLAAGPRTVDLFAVPRVEVVRVQVNLLGRQGKTRSVTLPARPAIRVDDETSLTGDLDGLDVLVDAGDLDPVSQLRAG